MASDVKALSQAAASVSSGANRARRVLLLGLGGLWLFDGLLQMQPYMFTMNLITQILRPIAAGQPWWLTRLIDWSIALVTPHLSLFNWSIVLLQITIGLSLWSGRRSLVTAGLWLSIAWGLAVWVFGEGIGGLLTGSPTFLSGAPGSVLLYVDSAEKVRPMGPDPRLCRGSKPSQDGQPPSSALRQGVGSPGRR